MSTEKPKYKVVEGAPEETKKKKKKKKVIRNTKEYIDLIIEHVGQLKKDVFTGDLCYFDKTDKRWVPLLNEVAIGFLKSKAIDKGGFNLSYFEHHIQKLTKDATKELLVNVPKWDGVDRFSQIAKCMKCTNLSPEAVESLLKDWFCKLFERLYNPKIQNRILVLQGGQGLGKDHLVTAMLEDLGQYYVPFLIQQQERDTFQQLISGLVMVISEYDRTNRTEVSTLKNMITAPRAYFRTAYARKPQFYAIRASFIATCNVDNILRDWTGNRRYIIMELDQIDWNYPQNDSSQFLAQAKVLAQEKFTASEGAEVELDRYLQENTPEDPSDIMSDDYEEMFITYAGVGSQGASSNDLMELWKVLAKSTGWSINYIRGILRKRGYCKRSKKCVIFYPTIEECERSKLPLS